MSERPFGFEAVHVAGAAWGASEVQTCARCGAVVERPAAHGAHAYADGERVVVLDGDPMTSWLSLRTPTCLKP